MEKDFEMSVTELAGYGYIIVCTYRSPDSKFWTFLKTLELIMQIAQSKNKTLLLCGDWNLNFRFDYKSYKKFKIYYRVII
jgi:hypothetical protein